MSNSRIADLICFVYSIPICLSISSYFESYVREML